MMDIRQILVTSLALLALLPSPLRADPLTPEEEQFLLCKNNVGTWIDSTAAVNVVKELGYEAFKLTVEKGCYEVTAYDRDKNVFEFYIHPISGELLLKKRKPRPLGP
ncbi:MAG: hypothetical protein A2516_07010 [Alphaproteobacteria bacterium RIFOXYD12_FULL_60_8]|nr:MAG: hypothetical protein A2516_07010 [Alphaproteobacteria bacterium RIFOXYD12_FULL_60_8]